MFLRIILTIIFSSVLVFFSNCSKSTDPPPPPPPPPQPPPSDTIGITPVSGLYYRGKMGSSVMDNQIEFKVTDSLGYILANTFLNFELIKGDGSLSADSAMTDDSGKVTINYSFDATLGHAVIRAKHSNVDSVDIFLRANTLILGNSGQGQYVLFDDRYIDIKNFNGEPHSIDVLGPGVFIIVANYEAELGVVFILYDPDTNGVIDDSSHVFGVVAVDSVFPQLPDSSTFSARYENKTKDSIGIGSFFLRDIFFTFLPETPVTITFQDDPLLPAIRIQYTTPLFLDMLCNTLDTAVFQMVINEEFDKTLFSKNSIPDMSESDSALRYYLINKRRK